MIHTPINKNSIRQHLTYNWWKYLLAVVLLGFAIDLAFTVTEYRPPENKKVELYIYGYADQDKINEYMSERCGSLMPEMEKTDCTVLMADEVYGDMQLSTYLAAGEGDIYILPKDKFISFAENSALFELENTEELWLETGLDPAELKSGWRKDGDSGEKHLYGIPTEQLPGLKEYSYYEDGFICVIINNGNDENVIRFMTAFCSDMRNAESAEAQTNAE